MNLNCLIGSGYNPSEMETNPTTIVLGATLLRLNGRPAPEQFLSR